MIEYADLGDIENLVRNPLSGEFREAQEFTNQTGNIIKLNALKPAVIIDIFKQLIANLEFLHQQVEFNHGDLKANNILIQSTSSRGSYKGLTWNSNFTLKIADFGKSSLTIVDDSGQRVRLFNYSSSSETYLSVFPFYPAIDVQFSEPYYLIDTNTNLSTLARLRHMGIPYYFSFDSYTFVISMLLIPEIFFPVMSNKTLRQVIWDNLWFQDDYSLAWNRVYTAIQQGKANSYSVILDILNGLKLKCQANNILLEGLKTL